MKRLSQLDAGCVRTKPPCTCGHLRSRHYQTTADKKHTFARCVACACAKFQEGPPAVAAAAA